MIAGGLVIWLLVRRTKFGTAMFAVGSDAEASHAVGISVEWTRFWAFVLGGFFYGLAGVFVGAQTGSPTRWSAIRCSCRVSPRSFSEGLCSGAGAAARSDRSSAPGYPDVDDQRPPCARRLRVFLHDRRGRSSHSRRSGSSVGSDSVLFQSLKRAGQWLGARAGNLLASQVQTAVVPTVQRQGRALRRASTSRASWLDRNQEQLRYVLPAYVAFVLVVIATQFVYSENIVFSLKYYNSLVVLGAFLAILALGQGAVILSGGLDLSLPWTIGFCGILAAGMIQGSNVATIWAVPLALGVGALIGFVNGLGVGSLGLPPIVVTLAMNGVLQGAALLYSNGTPAGFTSPALRWLMTGAVAGITPVVGLMALFILFGVTLLGRTVFGRWVYAVGNSPRASFLSGVGMKETTIGVYVLSGFCAGLVGVLITGFSGQASLGMGDDFLLPSIAVVIVGGTLITGGRGTYIGMLGGVLLLTALQTLLAGTTLPHAVRDIIFGTVVLISVLALREK